MNITIRNSSTHRQTTYTPDQLRTDARLLIKGKGKFGGYNVVFNEHGTAQLIVGYTAPTGEYHVASLAI